MIKHDETIMFCDREHLLYCLEWTSRVIYTILPMHDVETVLAKLGAKIFGVTKLFAQEVGSQNLSELDHILLPAGQLQ